MRTRLALRHLDRGNQRGDYRGERAGYAAASSTPVLEAVDIIISLTGARLRRRHAVLVQLHERHLLFAFGPARILPAPFHTPARHFRRAQCLRYEPACGRRWKRSSNFRPQSIQAKTRLSLGAVNIRLGNVVYFEPQRDRVRHEVKNRESNSRWISYRRVFTQPGPTAELG